MTLATHLARDKAVCNKTCDGADGVAIEPYIGARFAQRKLESMHETPELRRERTEGMSHRFWDMPHSRPITVLRTPEGQLTNPFRSPKRACKISLTTTIALQVRETWQM